MRDFVVVKFDANDSYDRARSLGYERSCSGSGYRRGLCLVLIVCRFALPATSLANYCSILSIVGALVGFAVIGFILAYKLMVSR